MSLTATEFDEVHSSLLHVKAMLTMIYGEGLNNFNNCSDEIRDNYLWACSEGVARAITGMEKSVKRDVTDFDTRTGVTARK